MKKITFLILSVFLTTLSWQVQAQCITNTAFGSGTLTNASVAPVTFTTCAFAGERSTVTINQIGVYRFTSSVGTDYLTFTDALNNPIAFGTTPIQVAVTTTGIYRLHVHTNPACGTASSCRALAGQYIGPPNNLCSNAVTITGNGTYPGTTINSVNSGAGTCVATSTSGDVWYVINDTSGTGYNITANTCSAVGYDTKLSVFTGSCGGLVCVTGNDDAACAFSGLRSSVNFTTDGSSTYYIMVHGFSASTGNFELNISGMMIGTAPQIVCPNDIVINNTTGTCGAQVFFNNAIAFDAEDGLIPVTQTQGPMTGSIFPIGDTIIEYSATDSDNNTSTCQFTITVLDVDDPIAACQNITVELDASGTVTIFADDLNLGAGTPDPVTPIACAGNPGPTSTIDTNLVSFSIVGENFTEIDFNNPCPGVTGLQNQTALSVDLVPGEQYTAELVLWTCGATQFVANANVWIDFNGDGVLTGDELILLGSQPGVTGGGPTGGNPTGGTTLTANFTVPAAAETGIVIIRAMVQETSVTNLNPCASYSWGSMVDFTANLILAGQGSSDLCGPVTFSFDPAGLVTSMVLDCSNLGDNTITLYVTDQGGNVVSCESIVTVEDNIAPVIVCSSSSTTVTDSVSGSPGVAIPDNNPTGVSSTLTITDDEIITDIDIDVNINHTWVGDVSVRITSPAGTMVTIIDRPGFTGTGFGCSGDNIVATLDDDAPSPVETQCAAAVPTINGTFSPNNPLSAFNGESTLGTWTITVFDSAGGDTGTLNSWAVVYSYDVTGGPIPQYVLDINGEVTVDINDLYISASDNCSVTVSAGGPGSSGPCSASNPSNAFENGKSNTAALNRIVANDLTVGDGEDFLLESISFNEFISPTTTVSFVNVFVYANAGGAPGALITSQTNIVPASQAVVGGNFGFDVRQVIVNITPVNLPGQTGNTTTYWIGISVQAADASNVFWENTTVASNGLGEAYNDGLGGGFIIDNTLDGVYTFSGSCSTGGGGGLTFTCADLGIVNVTITATDAAGNTTSCVTQIEIIDTMPPVIVGEDITVELGPDGTVCIVPEDLFGVIPPEYNVITISSDNGSGSIGFTDLVVTVTESVSVSFDWSYSTNDGPSFDSFGYIINGVYTELTNPVGANNQTGNATVPLTAGQIFGFRSRSEDGIFGPCTTTVSNFQPGFTGQFDPANWTQVLTNSDGSAVFVEITPGSTSAFDNCGITVTAIDISCFTCADIGTPVTVTIFASDASGNIASTTAVVTVVDLLGPVIDCPADMTVDTDPGSITYTLPNYIGDGLVNVTDNCTNPVTNFSQTPAPGTLLLDGTYTITLTATDQYGNVTTCSFELTVDTILGTDEIDLGNAIAMYPNPASGFVNLRNNSAIALTNASIYDISGKLVSKFDLSQMNGEQRLDVSNLASGVYMVYINSETASVVKRLIKK